MHREHSQVVFWQMQQIPRQKSLEEMQYLKHDELNPIFEEIKVHLTFLLR